MNQQTALRTSDGRERAKKSGVRFGPKPKLTRHQIEEVRRRKDAGDVAASDWIGNANCFRAVADFYALTRTSHGQTLELER